MSWNHSPSVPSIPGTDFPCDRIELSGIRIDCIVGIRPDERRRSQPLRIDLCLFLDTRPAGRTGKIIYTVDYAKLADEIRFLLLSSEFLLLETAAEALCRYLLLPSSSTNADVGVLATEVRLSKPEALGGTVCPSITAFRTAGEMSYAEVEKSFGKTIVVHTSRECGIYLHRIAGGRTIPTHAHQRMKECELILDRGLLLQGQPVQVGAAFQWPSVNPHRYDNPRASERRVLCVNRPPFDSDDEISSPVPVSELVLPDATHYYR